MDHRLAHERARDQPRVTRPRPRTPAAPERARPALVEPAIRPWPEIAERLASETSRRERRLRRALALSDVVAIFLALRLGHLSPPLCKAGLRRLLSYGMTGNRERIREMSFHIGE